MVTSRDQHAGQNRHKKEGSKSFKRVEQFKYLGTTLTNLSFIHEDGKSRMLAIILNNMFCLSVRYPKIKIYSTGASLWIGTRWNTYALLG